jgi:predicted dehydrogenase
MIKPLKHAVVGCGDIAKSVGRVVEWTSSVVISAAGDIHQDRVEAYAKRFKVKTARTDYAQLLAEGGFEAVYLAVPHNLHFKMIKDAADASVPILAEKPITRTLTEGKEIVAYAANAGGKLGVNYQYRYDRGFHALARAVQAGALGQVYYARINVPWHREWEYFEAAP